MKTKIDEAKDTTIEEPTKETTEKTKIQETTKSQSTINNSTQENNTTDPSINSSQNQVKFSEFTEAIASRVVEDDKTSRLHIEKELSYKLDESKKIKEITSINTKSLKGNKIGKKMRIDDYVQPMDIFNLMSMQYPEFKVSENPFPTKLYINIEKIVYQIEVQKKNLKIKKSVPQLSHVKNQSKHMELLKNKIKSEGIEKGSYEVLILDYQLNLEYKTNQNYFDILHTYIDSQIKQITAKP